MLLLQLSTLGRFLMLNQELHLGLWKQDIAGSQRSLCDGTATQLAVLGNLSWVWPADYLELMKPTNLSGEHVHDWQMR